jgi:bacillolysin
MKSKIVQIICSVITLPAVMLLSALQQKVMAQNKNLPLHPKLQVLAQPSSSPNWIDFKEGTTINPSTIFTDLKGAFQLTPLDTMKLARKEKDTLGLNHFRYQQYYKQRRVVYGEYFVHQQPGGFVKSANGNIITGLNLNSEPALTEQQALSNALQSMNARKYLWQNSDMEKELKRLEKNTNATYYPKGELVYAPTDYQGTLQASDYRLAWHFKIYTDDPEVTAKNVYVDAQTGKIIHYSDLAMNCSVGTGSSAYNGNVTIHTQLNGSSYRSLNDCQSTDIYVYNCNGAGASNTFYTDSDNTWSEASQQSAVQAQWGAEMTYNYYMGQHGRASWNGASGDMIAYNNAYAGSNNACWGCTGNSTIFFAGNTAAANDDWNTNDIMAHEFTHGVTQSSAGLIYRGESGALNESFSDIFGEMVESWSEGNCDYLVGADRGAIRSFIDPNAYGDPDTYLGTNWYTGTLDNGGVHTNSGVQNHWFYLLSEGGSGINDLGQTYNVRGITRFKARLIAYRALTMYLTSTAKYIDARKATLEAAWDLYGQCSPEIIAVGDAWHAVGVESQSPIFALNACGNYPASGTFVQSISRLTAADGCNTEITPNPTQVYFTARDQVILYPGFKAAEGSNFVAYLEPCSSTRWERASTNTTTPSSSLDGIKSDAEKGLNKQALLNKPTPAIPSEIVSNSISVIPNPFQSTFQLIMNLKEQEKVQVTIYNSQGVKVKEKHILNVSKGINKISFDCTNLAKGIYMVEIYTGNVKTVQKVVKM